MAVSQTGARLRNTSPSTSTSPSHLTRVRTIRIGLPQHVAVHRQAGLGGEIITCLISYVSLASLLLGCRKPEWMKNTQCDKTVFSTL